MKKTIMKEVIQITQEKEHTQKVTHCIINGRSITYIYL